MHIRRRQAQKAIPIFVTLVLHITLTRGQGFFTSRAATCSKDACNGQAVVWLLFLMGKQSFGFLYNGQAVVWLRLSFFAYILVFKGLIVHF